MAAPNHNRSDLYIKEMVLTRLPFLADTPDNTVFINSYTLEIMVEFEHCFKVDKDLPEGEVSRVGNEEHYTLLMKSVIADVVSVYIIMRKAMIASVGQASGTTDGTTGDKFLKSTKAGSVSVDWEQIDTKSAGAGLLLDSESMLKMYQNSAIRKMLRFGCFIIWDEEGFRLEMESSDTVAHFKVVEHGGYPYDQI